MLVKLAKEAGVPNMSSIRGPLDKKMAQRAIGIDDDKEVMLLCLFLFQINLSVRFSGNCVEFQTS